MRKLVCTLSLLAILTSCGEHSSSGSASGSGGGVSSPLVGTLSQLIIPSNATVPTFKDFTLSFYSWDAWASEANMPTPAGTQAVPSASSLCATSGCAFHSGRVSLSGATNGMFAMATSSDAAWLTTTSFIISPNQVQQAGRLGAQITAFNTAYAIPTAALASWASALGTDSNTLLERGVCLAFIWSATSGTGASMPGVTNATVTQNGGPAGVELAFPNESYLNLANHQTNKDGAVLLVGPSDPSSDAPVQIPLKIAYALAKKYPNPTAVVRPGTLSVMPILPQQQ